MACVNQLPPLKEKLRLFVSLNFYEEANLPKFTSKKVASFPNMFWPCHAIFPTEIS